MGTVKFSLSFFNDSIFFARTWHEKQHERFRNWTNKVVKELMLSTAQFFIANFFYFDRAGIQNWDCMKKMFSFSPWLLRDLIFQFQPSNLRVLLSHKEREDIALHNKILVFCGLIWHLVRPLFDERRQILKGKQSASMTRFFPTRLLHR